MNCRYLGAALALTLSLSACNNPQAKETASQVVRNTVLGMDTSLAIVQELAISVASNPAIPADKKRQSYDITHAAAMSLATLTEYVTAGGEVPESALADAQSKLLAAKTLVNSLNNSATGDNHE